VSHTASTEPLPPILTKAAAACFACWIAVSGRSLSPPFQGGSPNALNKRQVCHSGYWTDIDILSSIPAGCCNRRAWRRLNTPLHEVCSVYVVPWVRRQTRICPDDVQLALRSIEELPRNVSVRAMSRNSSQCELPHVERRECQTPQLGTPGTVPGMCFLTYPERPYRLRVRISHVGCSQYPVLQLGIAGKVPGMCILMYPERLHRLRVRTSAGSLVSWWLPGPKRTGFWGFSSGFGENQEKQAQQHSKSMEAQNEKTLIVCLPSSHRGLCLLVLVGLTIRK